MENTKFNKELFLKIYHGAITEEFESNFISTFGIHYKNFLESQLKEHNNNSKELATLIGIKERELLVHLKSYSIIENFSIRQWQQFLLGNMFVYVLKAILMLLGSIPLFYCIGYLILYGYFFGETDHSLLDVAMKNVPINRSACYIAGFIFSGIVAFFISLIKLKRLGRSFQIFVFIFFIYASTVSLLYILFNANTSFESSVIIKFLFIWLFPAIAAVLLLSTRYLTTILSKHYKEIGIVMIVASLFPIFLTKQLGLTLSLILYFVIVILLSRLLIKIWDQTWFPTKKKKSKKHKNNSSIQSFSLSEFWFYILFVTSLFVVIVIPMLCFIMFSTGNYLGSALSIVGLTKNEDIRIKNTLIDGKLVAEDDNYLYISTSSRTLLEVSKDASIQIAKPNELMVYTGKSENWTININVYYRDNNLWYSGIIKNIKSINTTKLTYKLQNIDKITLEHSKPTLEFYIFDKIESGDIKNLTFIDLFWLSSNGIVEQEKVIVNVSDLN